MRITIRRAATYLVHVAILAMVLVPLAFVTLGALGPVLSGFDPSGFRPLVTMSAPASA